MTNEEKQALIEACEDTIKYAKDYPSHEVEMAKAALITLTAQPVNLSNCRTLWYDHDDLSAEVKCIPVKDIKKAIRAAGYEVQE